MRPSLGRGLCFLVGLCLGMFLNTLLYNQSLEPVQHPLAQDTFSLYQQHTNQSSERILAESRLRKQMQQKCQESQQESIQLYKDRISQLQKHSSSSKQNAWNKDTLWKQSIPIHAKDVANVLASTIPVQNSPKNALFFSHQNPTTFQLDQPQPLLNVSENCPELVVAVVARKQCLAVLESTQDVMPYHLFRYRRDAHHVNDASEWQLTPYIKKWTLKLPNWKRTLQVDQLLVSFFGNLAEMTSDVKRLLPSLKTNKDIVVMAINQGNLDLILNFIHSARKSNISLDNLIVFGADQKVVKVLSSIGVISYSHKGLGEFPENVAKQYGDRTFNKMMWLKIAPLYIVAGLGYNVLFQDADHVWFKDPIPGLQHFPEDSLWMDDGARTERFSPLFANSGFYYLRNNPRTSLLLQDFLFSYNVISNTGSHQEVVIQRTIDHIGRYALTFRLLDPRDFPSGAVYHMRKKTLMKEIRQGSHIPFVFHMCWTESKRDKIKYFKELGWWYLGDSCEIESIIADPGSISRQCSPLLVSGNKE